MGDEYGEYAKRLPHLSSAHDTPIHTDKPSLVFTSSRGAPPPRLIFGRTDVELRQIVDSLRR